MKIFIERQNKWIDVNIKKKAKVIDVLKKLKINPSAVIVVRNNELITEDEIIKNDEKIKVLSVVSGG